MAIRTSWRSTEAGGRDRHGHLSLDHHRTRDVARIRHDRWLAKFCGPARCGHLDHSVSAGRRQGLAAPRRADLWPLEPASTNLGAALGQVAPPLKPLAGPVLAF